MSKNKQGIVLIDSIADLSNQQFIDNNKRWQVSALIEKAANLSVQTMPLSALNIFKLHPNINSLRDFIGHMKSVLEVDMQYPIILDDEGYVMDGRHRIAKALLEGHNSIKFVRFDTTPTPDFIDEGTEK